MAARATLTSSGIINEVNALVGDASWFTDDEIQSALDRHRVEHFHTKFNARSQFDSSGQAVYKVWDVVTYLENATFTDLDYTAVTFSSSDNINGRYERALDLEKQYILLNGFEHDIYSAAADLLGIRAAQKVEDVTTFSAVNGSYTKAAVRQSLEAKAESYRKLAKVHGGSFDSFQIVDLVRDDMA